MRHLRVQNRSHFGVEIGPFPGPHMRVFGLPAAIPKVIFHADHQSAEYRELRNYLWGIISYFEVIKHELLTTPKRTFRNSVSCPQHVFTSNEVLRTMDVLTTGVAAI